jgi:uncharacterized C2H2 Zn-finger protein
MAQDIIIRTLCDVCLSTDEHTDAKPYRIADGPVSLDIDLCEIHRKPLADLLDHARPASTASNTAAGPGTACPTCGKVLRTPRGLRKHLTQQHGAEDPGAPTLTGTDGYTCPDCGRGFGKPQGLSMHRFRAHGIRAEGNPTGSA